MFLTAPLARSKVRPVSRCAGGSLAFSAFGAGLEEIEHFLDPRAELRGKRQSVGEIESFSEKLPKPELAFFGVRRLRTRYGV